MFKLITIATCFGAILFLPGLKAAALTQEMPVCYMINSSGELINLNEMCLKQQQVLSSKSQLQSVYGKIDTALKAGRLEEATEGITQLIVIQPSADLYSFRGHIHLVTGDSQGAIADLQKASELYRAKKELGISNYLQGTINDIRNGKTQINRQQ